MFRVESNPSALLPLPSLYQCAFLLLLPAIPFFTTPQFIHSFIHSSSSVSNGVEMMGIVKGLSRNNAHWYGGGGGDSGWSLGQKKRRRPLSLAEQLHGDTRNFFYNKEKGVVWKGVGCILVWNHNLDFSPHSVLLQSTVLFRRHQCCSCFDYILHTDPRPLLFPLYLIFTNLSYIFIFTLALLVIVLVCLMFRRWCLGGH